MSSGQQSGKPPGLSGKFGRKLQSGKNSLAQEGSMMTPEQQAQHFADNIINDVTAYDSQNSTAVHQGQQFSHNL